MELVKKQKETQAACGNQLEHANRICVATKERDSLAIEVVK